MAGLLYDPEKGDFPYNLPIFDNDNAISAFTWRYLIDTFVANNGHNANPELFRNHIQKFLRMIREDVWETYTLCEKEILKEIENDN